MLCMPCCAVLCVLQVRLVLEYCDKGCLRAALDDSVFIMGEPSHLPDLPYSDGGAVLSHCPACCAAHRLIAAALETPAGPGSPAASYLLAAAIASAYACRRLGGEPPLTVLNILLFVPVATRAENGGINYLAILDTAADVAKAMLHLHSLNVLHSDL